MIIFNGIYLNHFFFAYTFWPLYTYISDAIPVDNDSNSDSNCGMTKISILDTRNGTYTWSQNFEPSNVLSNITFPIGNTPHSDNIIIGIAAEILVLILIAAILFIKSRLRQNVSASSPELEGVASETSLLEAREFTKHLEGELQTFTESMGEDASQNTFSPEPEQRDSTEIMEGGDSSKILTEIMEKDDSRTGSSAEPMELQTSLEIMKVSLILHFDLQGNDFKKDNPLLINSTLNF